jgi:hypothetical protein
MPWLGQQRDVLRARLVDMERRVAEGERQIARQREIVKSLGGNDDVERAANKLLRVFEEVQAEHLADRDRLRARLAG